MRSLTHPSLEPRGATPSRRPGRLRATSGIPARPIRLQDFATSRKSPPLFGRGARSVHAGEAGEKRRLCRAALEKRHCRTGEQSLSLLQPHSLSMYSSPSGRISSHRLRLPPVKVRVTELSVTTAWKRLSWTETAFEAATGLYLPRLWPPAETQSLYTRLSQSGSYLVSDRFWHWQNYLTLDLTIDIQ